MVTAIRSVMLAVLFSWVRSHRSINDQRIERRKERRAKIKARRERRNTLLVDIPRYDRKTGRNAYTLSKEEQIAEEKRLLSEEGTIKFSYSHAENYARHALAAIRGKGRANPPTERERSGSQKHTMRVDENTVADLAQSGYLLWHQKRAEGLTLPTGHIMRIVYLQYLKSERRNARAGDDTYLREKAERKQAMGELREYDSRSGRLSQFRSSLDWELIPEKASAEVREVLSWLASGSTQEEVAEHFGRTQSWVSKLCDKVARWNNPVNESEPSENEQIGTSETQTSLPVRPQGKSDSHGLYASLDILKGNPHPLPDNAYTHGYSDGTHVYTPRFVPSQTVQETSLTATLNVAVSVNVWNMSTTAISDIAWNGYVWDGQGI